MKTEKEKIEIIRKEVEKCLECKHENASPLHKDFPKMRKCPDCGLTGDFL